MGGRHGQWSQALESPFPFHLFFSHKYKLKRIDWPSFSSNLLDSVQINEATFTDWSLDRLTNYNLLIEGIVNAVSSACPPSSPIINPLCSSSLVGRNLQPSRRWKKTIHQSLYGRRNKSYPNYLIMKKSEAKAKRSFINLARRNSLRKFCNSLDRMTPISRIWRVVKCFKNRFTQPAVASCSADRKVSAKLHYLIDEQSPPTVFHDKFPSDFKSIENRL